MGADECIAELDRRKLPYARVTKAPGVLAPVRLRGPLGGVTYRVLVREHERGESPYEVLDCRLLLALSDFSAILRAHDVDEVLLFSAWRPPPRSWPAGKLATRHPGGLAVDVYRFGKKALPGRERIWLDVKTDFHGRIGPPPCGSGAPPPAPATPAARELRSIVCEAADQHVFTTILTPSYDRAHHNHLHLEITPGVKWYLVR